MTKRMLIDATHAEETRVVVLDGNRLEDFDVETSTKKQLKGNIYLAKIVRVEPSLQAAFVEYGGTRHGFLAFGEIHPDYYQIPIADRQRLVAQQAQEAREAEEAEDAAADAESGETVAGADDDQAPAADSEMPETLAQDDVVEAGSAEPLSGSGEDIPDSPSEPALADWPVATEPPAQPALIPQDVIVDDSVMFDPIVGEAGETSDAAQSYDPEPIAALAELGLSVGADGQITGDPESMQALRDTLSDEETGGEESGGEEPGGLGSGPEFETDIGAPPETVGGETEIAEEREQRAPPRFLRNYKIQEVIRRRQIMLVQVVKEERGGKGAALTTYISLAGRFCVLMPNSPRGGGISRKITSVADRRRLKEITTELAIPSGMGLIVRTAGAARPKPEIRRDCEYLLQLWDDIRDTTMQSVAPAAIYEEASLIKRAIRDVYSRDVDEVMVDGEGAWRAARDQMRLLMPSHAHKVQLWQDSQPLFAHHQVDAQLDAMLSPTVQLRSGGYLVINQTEALVAIDVNSGRSTRERGIEETALRTNSEAAEEVARQLRLRDLAGLIVIDFIDMEQRRNNATVERKLKDALKNDRARIQLGSISHFGLMEMSRQRLRPSLAETSFVQCSHCSGTGMVRSTEGAAIHVLRAIEEEGGKRRAAEIMVHVAGPIAMYVLNHKRARLIEIEARYGMSVMFTPDPALLPPAVKIDRLRNHEAGAAPPIQQRPAGTSLADTAADAHIPDAPDAYLPDEDTDDTVPVARAAPRPVPMRQAPAQGHQPAEAGAETADATKRRRRRRRRGGRRDDAPRDENALSPLAEPDADQPAMDDADAIVDIHAVESADTIDALSSDAPSDASLEAPHDAESEGDSGAANGPDGAPRRRGRRGGRRRRRDAPADGSAETVPIADAPPAYDQEAYASPVYTGPTPANPFGGDAFDIFDALEQAEAAEIASLTRPVPPPAGAEPAPAVSTLEMESVETPPVEVAPVEAAPVEQMPVEAPVVAAARAPRAPRVRASRAKQPAAAPAGLFAVAPPPPAEPEPEAVAVAPPAEPEAPPDPLLQPVLVDDAPPAPKRGWWKR